MESEILYAFITHKGNIDNCYDRICEMMGDKDDYLIFHGGELKDTYDKDKKVVGLNCHDGYVGLPEKVMKMFHFILSEESLSEFTHIFKLDDDMVIHKRFDTIEYDFAGHAYFGEGDPRWHMGRCGNFWDKLEWTEGYNTPWCFGGEGYVVSRNILNKIIPNHDYLNHIYEDVYIGELMNNIGINPISIPKLKSYMTSPDHGVVWEFGEK